MQINSDGVRIGTISIAYFGLFLVAGLLAGGGVSALAANRRGERTFRVLDALSWVVMLGVVGARLIYMLAPPPSAVLQGLTTHFYLAHLFDVQNGFVAIWEGGLNLWGGLAGGLLGLWIYTRRQQLDFALWLDIAALGAPLGIAIGSLGNLVNRQLLGPETTLPWGISVAGAATHHHPAPAYLSLWAILALLVLHWVASRYGDNLRAGDLFLLFIALIAPGLIMFETLRVDKQLLVAGIGWMQMVAGLAGVAALLSIGLRQRKMVAGAKGHCWR